MSEFQVNGETKYKNIPNALRDGQAIYEFLKSSAITFAEEDIVRLDNPDPTECKQRMESLENKVR
jgi:hypothetical protein